MKNILILGADTIGESLAIQLINEGLSITVIDTSMELLSRLQDRLDIQIVCGTPSHPDILEKADAIHADILIAVTQTDEINVVACFLAKNVFKIPIKIACIRSKTYFESNESRSVLETCIDQIIHPAQLVTQHIKELLEFPGVIDVFSFASERVQIASVQAFYGGLLVNRALRCIREDMPEYIDTRVIAIFRKGVSIPLTGDTIVHSNDEVFFIAPKNQVSWVMQELRKSVAPYRRIIIAGGGQIGFALAQLLEKNYSVKIIEFSRERCIFLAKHLNNTVILNRDITDKEILLEESIENVDLFCALTNDDENNILASLLAKKMGARQVFSLINKGAYIDLLSNSEIDIVFSPQQVISSELLKYIRQLDIENAHNLRRGASEVLEVVVRGNRISSKVIGKKIRDLQLKEGVSICALIRHEEIFIAQKDLCIESDDHIIIFVADKKLIPYVEKLF